MERIKSIDVDVIEYNDNINANTYFEAVIIINKGTGSNKVLQLPLQYGYGDHYKDKVFQALKDEGYIADYEKSLTRFANNHSIILRFNKMDGGSYLKKKAQRTVKAV